MSHDNKRADAVPACAPGVAPNGMEQLPKPGDKSLEHGRPANRYIGHAVYGALDGIVTTFAVVSGVEGAQLSARIILILGLANLLADGFSMATGAYLSARSEQEYYEREWQQEVRQIQHQPERERESLYTLYRDRGYAEADARHLVAIQTRHPLRWARVMMVEELALLAEDRNPLPGALVTFCAFVLAGSIPLIVYLFGLFVPIPAAIAFFTSLGLSGVALFGLGAAKVLVTERNPWRSGVEMLVIGGLAAGVAYMVGALLKQL